MQGSKVERPVAAQCNYRYKDPPPYPGHGRHLYQSGWRQSYSGSETSTDVSLSSSENLSSSVRQEPQGEETIVCAGMEPCRGPIQYLDQPGVEVKSTNNSTFYVTGNKGCHGGDLKYGYSGVREIKSSTPQAKSMMSQYRSDAMRLLCQQMCHTQKLYPGSAMSSPVPGKMKVVPMQHFSQQSTPVTSATGLPDGNQSLSQLMSALSRNSSTQSSLHRDRQRPATAPTMRHLPAPPQFPDYSRDTHNSPDLENTALRRSQPDLSRLAELSLPQQYEIGLVNNDPNLTRPSNLGFHGDPSLNCDTNNNNNNSGSRGSPYQQMALSSASLVQQQLAQLHHLQAMAGTKQLPDAQLPMIRPMTAPSSTQGNRLGLTSPDNSVPPSPDKLQPSLHSPNLRKLQELEYLTRESMSQQLVDPNNRGPTLVDHAAIATRATQMVERLSEENRCLRQELEGYYKKVYRLQKLEHEIQKVHENYETLVKHSHKQQNLEKLIRLKLEAEVKLIRETNKELKDQLEKSLRQLQQKDIYNMLDAEIKKELLGKDSLIARLISQNQDLTMTREQLELDYNCQKCAMNDQMVHLKLLESALASARTELLQYEEESQKRKRDNNKICELQNALSQLQIAVETRETIEHKLREKLEEEVQYLRNQQQIGSNKSTDADEGIASDTESPTSLQSLLHQLTEKEQRILSLEADVAKVMVILAYMWKQKYLEEMAMRQFSVDAASMSKDARIQSLEQSSLETEKMAADARTDCIKQMDEVHSTNRKCAQLESKLKTLQAQLAEKDAMILILQRHTGVTSPVSTTIASLLGPSLHSTRPSFSSPLTSPLISPLTSPLIHHTGIRHPHSSPLIRHTDNPSGASSRQNSQLDSSSNYSSGSSIAGGNDTTDIEGKICVHSKSSSTSSAASSISSSSKEKQLIKEKLAAQGAFGVEMDCDPMKKYMWQV